MSSFLNDQLAGTLDTGLSAHTATDGSTWGFDPSFSTSESFKLTGSSAIYPAVATTAVYTNSNAIPGGTKYSLECDFKIGSGGTVGSQICGLVISNGANYYRLVAFNGNWFLQNQSASLTQQIAQTLVAGNTYHIKLQYDPTTSPPTITGVTPVGNLTFTDNSFTPNKIGVSTFNSPVGTTTTGHQLANLTAQTVGIIAGTLSLASSAYNSVVVGMAAPSAGTSPYTYQLQRSPAGAGTWTNVGTALTGQTGAAVLADLSVAASTAYDYRVQITDAASSTANTNTVTTTTKANAAAQYQICFVGDSLTLGKYSTIPGATAGTSYPANVMTALGFTNFCSGGQSGANVGGNFGVDSMRIDQFTTTSLDAQLNFGFKGNLLFVFGGTNDINQGASAATAFSRLTAYCLDRRSKGWNPRTGGGLIIATIPPANLVSGTFDSIRNTFNAYIRTYWRTFADWLWDIALDARVGPDGAWSNTIYFNGDQIHFTDAGYAVLGGSSAGIVAGLAYPGGPRPKTRQRIGNVPVGV